MRGIRHQKLLYSLVIVSLLWETWTCINGKYISFFFTLSFLIPFNTADSSQHTIVCNTCTFICIFVDFVLQSLTPQSKWPIQSVTADKQIQGETYLWVSWWFKRRNRFIAFSKILGCVVYVIRCYVFWALLKNFFCQSKQVGFNWKLFLISLFNEPSTMTKRFWSLRWKQGLRFRSLRFCSCCRCFCWWLWWCWW
jgi:hypothetical protein